MLGPIVEGAIVETPYKANQRPIKHQFLAWPMILKNVTASVAFHCCKMRFMNTQTNMGCYMDCQRCYLCEVEVHYWLKGECGVLNRVSKFGDVPAVCYFSILISCFSVRLSVNDGTKEIQGHSHKHQAPSSPLP